MKRVERECVCGRDVERKKRKRDKQIDKLLKEAGELRDREGERKEIGKKKKKERKKEEEEKEEREKEEGEREREEKNLGCRWLCFTLVIIRGKIQDSLINVEGKE